MYFWKWTLSRLFTLRRKSNMNPLEEVFNLSLICVIETWMWVMMDIPIEVQIKLTNLHMKQSIQFMLEELQHFSYAGTCRYQLKAKNWFCLAFVKIIFQSHFTTLNGALIYALAIAVTLVKLLLTWESKGLLCYMQILAIKKRKMKLTSEEMFWSNDLRGTHP